MKARTLLVTVAVTGMMGLAPGIARAQGGGQTPATQNTGQKNYKDRAEYDLYDAITKDSNPKTLLEKLNQWKEKYPATDFSDERQGFFLTTYAALGQVQDALNTAKEILAKDPKNFTAMYYTVLLTPKLPSKATDEQLAAAETAANGILGGAKPSTVSDADWQKAKNDVEAIAHKALGYVAKERQQWDTAEAEYKKALAMMPNDSENNYWLGVVILYEKKPEKQAEALYDYARAAAYEGPGALAAPARNMAKSQLTTMYTKYHGGADGLDQLLAQAKTAPTPPPDFKIVSVVDKEKAKLEQEEQDAKAHPDLAMWKGLKDTLTSADGPGYFEKMKGANVPGGAGGVQKFTGKVVRLEPAVKPKTVVLAISDPTVADATLKFEVPLPGKVDPGTTLSFSGIADSYTANPFMIVFTVDKKDLSGWTGTNPAPARAPVHHRPAAH